MKNAASSPNSMQQQIDLYKKEKDILLALSNDITRVRDKNDLIILFSKRIKDYTILRILSLLSES